MNADTLSLVKAAVKELALDPPGRSNPWGAIESQLTSKSDEWLDWWWRSINKIDIPTWHTLRAKVVELRLRA